MKDLIFAFSLALIILAVSSLKNSTGIEGAKPFKGQNLSLSSNN